MDSKIEFTKKEAIRLLVAVETVMEKIAGNPCNEEVRKWEEIMMELRRFLFGAEDGKEDLL